MFCRRRFVLDLVVSQEYRLLSIMNFNSGMSMNFDRALSQESQQLVGPILASGIDVLFTL